MMEQWKSLVLGGLRAKIRISAFEMSGSSLRSVGYCVDVF